MRSGCFKCLKIGVMIVLCGGVGNGYARPVGFENLGASCYFNALMQNLLNIEPLRAKILSKTASELCDEFFPGSERNDLDQRDECKKSAIFAPFRNLVAEVQRNQYGVISNKIMNAIYTPMLTLGGMTRGQDDAGEALRVLERDRCVSGLLREAAGFEEGSLLSFNDGREKVVADGLSELRKQFNAMGEEEAKGLINQWLNENDYQSNSKISAIVPTYFIQVKANGGDVDMTEGVLKKTLNQFVAEYYLEGAMSGENKLRAVEKKHQGITFKLDIEGRKRLVINCKNKQMPEFLIIQLTKSDVENKRAKKLSEPLPSLSSQLILQEQWFIPDTSPDEIGRTYSLIGVGVHSGSLSGGHYYAYIKDQFDPARPWYKCNDSRVTRETSLPDDARNGYVFFYRKTSAEEASIAAQEAQRAVAKLSRSLQAIEKGLKPAV